MKILEICLFSAGACGVWQRVKTESTLLAKKHEVRIFSSNLTKGSERIAAPEGMIEKVMIKRFSALKPGEGKLKFLPGGESFMFFNFEKEALEYEPDLIIAHVYRHNHTLKALKIAKKLKKQGKETKVILVTHASFGRDSSRSFISKMVVKIYDLTLGKLTINKFDKVIRISNWEIPYLEKLGLKEEKLIYIPNGIDEDFFSIKKSKQKSKDLIYAGRISPIKSLETLIRSMKNIPKQKLKIFGPAEENYLKKLNKVIAENSLQNIVEIVNKTFDKKELIENLDSSEIFILPSLTEGHPQSLVEAMARGKIVLASDNEAAKDLIVEGKNGFLFKVKDSKELTNKLKRLIKLNSEEKLKISKNAENTARKFQWKNLINKLLKEIK